MNISEILAQHQARTRHIAERLGVDVTPEALAFAAGGLVTLRRYAWWRDGEQRVGCGVYSLDQAEIEFIEDVLASCESTTEKNK